MTSDLRWYDVTVAMLPIVLYATLGVTGLAVGSAGAAVSLALTAAIRSRPLRMGLSVVVTFAAFLLWSVLIVRMR